MKIRDAPLKCAGAWGVITLTQVSAIINTYSCPSFDLGPDPNPAAVTGIAASRIENDGGGTFTHTPQEEMIAPHIDLATELSTVNQRGRG
jgi:hypothetical protein